MDPANPQHVVIAAFSSCWSQTCDANVNAALWTTVNGGTSWTKSYSVPPPTNVAAGSGCPCDQTPDYGRASRLFVSFLNELSSPPGRVYTGVSTNPTSATGWHWQISGGAAEPTNVAGTDADQPWLVTGPNPSALANDNVYVGYDDFSTSAPTIHVAVDAGTLPSSAPLDRTIGVSSACCINPGLRLATNHASGAVYALWQQATFNSATTPKIRVQYRLNRSIDGGKTWTLNGSPTGVQLASVGSDQIYDANTATPVKFGTVNALRGGIDSLAVDPTNGDVYVVYGQRDAGTAKNRLAIVRLTKNSNGGLTAGVPTFVTGQVQSALPSIAVAASGEIGVLYDTFDGVDGSGFPKFSAHLAKSLNRGATFRDLTLSTWSSAVKDNGSSTQRVLGDYQQMKTTGLGFYGTFTANGLGFGRPFANTDAIYFNVPADPVISAVTPAALGRRASAQRVVISGHGFQAGAKVTFANPGVTASGAPTVTATTITLSVSVSPTATVGKTNMTVTNPNGGTTTCSCFTVDAAPTVTTATPGSLPRSTTNKPVVITGTGFVSGASAGFGPGVTVASTVWNSSTKLTATISVATNATIGTRTVTVSNPDKGAGNCTNCFAVT